MNTLSKNLLKKYPLDDLTVHEFTNVKEFALIECKICHKIYEFKKAENAYRRKSPFCSCIKEKEQIPKYQKQLNEKYPNEQLLIISYLSKVFEIECLVCGHIFSTSKSNILNNEKKVACKSCFPGKYQIISEYKRKFIYWYKTQGNKHFDFPINFKEVKRVTDELHCICNYCKKINTKPISEYIKNTKCLCQCTNRLKTNKQFLKELEQKEILKEYEILDSYTGAFNKIKVKHLCGFVWEIAPHNLLLGKGCPRCNRSTSKGEKYIEKLLEQNKVSFVSQYPIYYKNKKLLIDFLINDNIAIEYQGIQHFNAIDFFGGEKRLKIQQENDELKREYCKKNNIQLIYYYYNQSFSDIKLSLISLLKFNDYPEKEYATN